MEFIPAEYEGFRLLLSELIESQQGVLGWFTLIARVLLAFLAIVITARCAISLLKGKTVPEIWGYLAEVSGRKYPIKHWENQIGRSRSCDIVINYPTVSRNHAALIRDDKGNWKIYDTNSKTGVYINDEKIDGSAQVNFGDTVTLGGVAQVLCPLSPDEQAAMKQRRPKPGSRIRPGITLLMLTEFQILLLLQHIISAGPDFDIALPIVFSAFCLIMWGCYIFYRSIKRVGFEVETIAFFLTTIGLSVAASSAPKELFKQLAAIVAGIALFLLLCFCLRDLKRAKRLRWPAAAAAIGLLGATQVFGELINGARNWIYIGGVSIQPSELVKVAFVYAGAATLDRLLAKRNLVLFIVFTGICVGALCYMGDFGAALIFFVTFLVISFLRSGSIFAVALYCSAAVFAGILAISLKPYIANRFALWGNAWSYAYDQGFQQTRTMSAAASGGLFGVGAGRGWLKNIFASDTDLVFGMVCEELGLIIALCAIACIVILAVFAVKSAANGRSAFYVIAAGAAVSMLAFQTALNVFGSVDILPLTGVTFPFVSNGGSSIVSAFGMMAFIKATDTRQNASPAIKLQKKTDSLLSDFADTTTDTDYDYDSDSNYDADYNSDSDFDSGFGTAGKTYFKKPKTVTGPRLSDFSDKGEKP